MPRLSRLSNPTGIVDIEKHRISITVDDQGSRPCYALTGLDVDKFSLRPDLRVIVIARRDKSELRTDHGPLCDWSKAFVDLSTLATEGTWVFRLLLVDALTRRILAVAENVRPNGLGQSESIIGLEPADDLGQVPWELRVEDGLGRALVRFNRAIYPSAAAVEADKYFTSLVLPEAVRALAKWHVANENAIADEHWEPFANWLAMLGVSIENNFDGDPEAADAWCREIVMKFCDRFRSVDVLVGSFVREDEE